MPESNAADTYDATIPFPDTGAGAGAFPSAALRRWR